MLTDSGPTSTIFARNISTRRGDLRPCRRVRLELVDDVRTTHRGLGFELDDLDDVDELVQLLGDLLQGNIVDVDDHSDPRELIVLGHADGEAVDDESAAGDESGEPGEHTGLVLDQD